MTSAWPTLSMSPGSTSSRALRKQGGWTTEAASHCKYRILSAYSYMYVSPQRARKWAARTGPKRHTVRRAPVCTTRSVQARTYTCSLVCSFAATGLPLITVPLHPSCLIYSARSPIPCPTCHLYLQQRLPWTKSPLITNAPMGGFATASLASAVTLAGGL